MEKTTKLTIIDADTIAYLVAYKFQEERMFAFAGLATTFADSKVRGILNATTATHYIGFLGTSKPTFRHIKATTAEYKGTRAPDDPAVKHWKPIIKAHLVEKWGFVLCDGIEADDAVIIAHEHYRLAGVDVSIASQDKDLKQVPCKYFNVHRSKWCYQYVTAIEGARNLAAQTLQGDHTDSIPGLLGIGKVTSEKVFAKLDSFMAIGRAVVAFYFNYHKVLMPTKAKKLDDTKVKDQYKIDNNLTRIAKKVDKEAVAKLCKPLSDFYTKTDEEIIVYLREQFMLVRMLKRPAYGFVIPEMAEYKSFQTELAEEKQFDFENVEEDGIAFTNEAFQDDEVEVDIDEM